jgi:glycosyltransferase involved in cell wall biosynthesis
MRLTVGVPSGLLELEPTSGHGKMWHRVLAELRPHARVVALTQPRGIRRRGVDVVLASGHDPVPDTNAPLVVQVHECGWFTEELRATIEPAFLAHIAAQTEHAVTAATQVITPSEAARRDLIASYDLEPGRMHAVHHGLDPAFLAAGADGRELVARGRGGAAAPYVLFAAALHPRKNLAAVRDAISALAGEGHPQLLAIAGRPPADRADASELVRAASAELPGAPGRVVMLGEPSDRELAALMAGADAFCLPSLYEGFGLTALEAMGAGAPVIVSDRGALPEVVGDAGLVVEPTAESVADALRKVLGDPELAAGMRERAIVRAREFTWSRTAEGWLAVLRAAVAGS